MSNQIQRRGTGTGGGAVAGGSGTQDEFHTYLRSLQLRASEISQQMAKLQLRERAPNWPKLLTQFALLASQLQTLYDELLTNEKVWSSRLHTANTLCQPLSHTYNPATTLRVKPTDEADQFEQQAFDAFRNDPELGSYSPIELRDQLNDYNSAVLKLGRFGLQAAALPLPKDPTLTTAATYPGTRKLDLDRMDENELQKSLASMMTGRATKLQPANLPPTTPTQPTLITSTTL